MLDKNSIAPLERMLEQTRSSQNELMERLRETESEADMLRDEIAALEKFARDTEQRINRLLLKMRPGSQRSGLSAELTIEDAAPQSDEGRSPASFPIPQDLSSGQRDNTISFYRQNRGIPMIANTSEPLTNRFNDRTITQACTLLLRESGRPLHVNELYNSLISGGMKFKGNNPTISIAVSLNRNRRFRKVGPGTFELVMREALQAVS
jgi:hypothetical protein